MENYIGFVEGCIKTTLNKFRESPKSFWSEDDLHCYLKALLLRGRFFKRGREQRVFVEFHTRARYKRGKDDKLFKAKKGTSGRFDIAGWDAQTQTTWDHNTQQLAFAIEVKYFDTPKLPKDWLIQVENDLYKLSDNDNGVPESGRYFLLFLAKDYRGVKERTPHLTVQYPTVKFRVASPSFQTCPPQPGSFP